VEFCVERCSSTGTSPTGALPALELAADLAGASQTTDLAAARAILQHLRKAGQAALDVDARLDPAQRAEVVAFGLMVQSQLEPATLWSTWLEKRGFQEFRQVGSVGRLSVGGSCELLGLQLGWWGLGVAAYPLPALSSP